MTKRKNNKTVLGRGLDALLNNSDDNIKYIKESKLIGNIIELEIEEIEINPYQPRDNFNVQKIEELALSIEKLGVIQPITVRKLENGGFQLISGERRLRASKLIGLITIPSFIRITNDSQSLEMALVENIQREDLDSIEIVLSYQRLILEMSITQEELSERIGKKRSTITNYLRLLKLDPIIQSGIRDGFLSMGHGRELVSIENRKNQLELYEKIIAKDLSVRKTEELAKKFKLKNNKNLIIKPQHIEDGIVFLESFFNSKVNITYTKEGKGVISINYNSQQDFDRIKNKLKK